MNIIRRRADFPFCHKNCPTITSCKANVSFSSNTTDNEPSPIVGAWSRDYFVGGWDFSSDKDETVYNVQTNSLFLDLRIPKSRNQILNPAKTCLEDYTNLELRVYARQHVFSGFSVVETHRHGRSVCTRHHVLDWNFIGVPRSRPNKWWIEFKLHLPEMYGKNGPFVQTTMDSTIIANSGVD